MPTRRRKSPPRDTSHAGQFERFALFLRANPVAAVMALLTLGVAFGGYQVLQHVDSIIEAVAPAPQTEAANFHKGVKRGVRVQQALESVRDEIDADRIVLAEFSNGSRSQVGVPWAFWNAKAAAVAPGIAYDLAEQQRMPIPMFAEYFAEMWDNPAKPVCITHKVDEVKSSLARARLKGRSTHQFIMCPIQGKDGVPLGTVTLGFVNRTTTGETLANTIATMKRLGEDLAPVIGLDDLR